MRVAVADRPMWRGARGCGSVWRWDVSEPRSAPTIGQLVLSKQLQTLRENAGLSREQAGKLPHVTAATVRRMDTPAPENEENAVYAGAARVP